MANRTKRSKAHAKKPAKKAPARARTPRKSPSHVKGWETRRANERERARIAAEKARKRQAARKKAHRAKLAKQREEVRKKEARRESQRRYRKKRAATEKARALLVKQHELVEQGRELTRKGVFEVYRRQWYEKWLETRGAWVGAKVELEESADDALDYEGILEAIADDEAIDWHVAYGADQVQVAP